MQINECFVKIDKITDYIPIVSTVMNLTNLFQKIFTIPALENEALFPLENEVIFYNKYYTYLNEKSFSRCIILLVPILGNIIIGIYDLIKEKERYMNEEEILDIDQISDGLLEHCISNECIRSADKENKSFSEKSSVNNYCISDEEMLEEISRGNYSVLDNASDEVRNDEQFMIEALKTCGDPRILQYASDELKNDEQFIHEAFGVDAFNFSITSS